MIVVAKLKALEGKGDDIEREFRKLLPKVLKEPGTKTYIIHRGLDNPNDFLVYEKYENDEAFKFHGSTEYFKEFWQAIKSLLDGRPELGIYNELT